MKKQLGDLSDYPVELIKSISEIVEICGEIRDVDIDIDLGGDVLVVENIGDIKELKNGMLKDILPEYTDKIICSEEFY
ncbi:hypothetical protein [Clostridium perfringens]|uniref:hypothetical protein n=1 Tax=Clostridium perfringens TaxID=1502 RepID=UPI0039EC3D89